MATTKTRTEGSEALKQVTYLASALKAPRITEAASPGTSLTSAKIAVSITSKVGIARISRLIV